MASKRHTRHRRIDRNKAPWDQLPIVHVEGTTPRLTDDTTVTVVRGPFNVTDLNADDLFWVLPGHDYVVFTNRLGRHRLYPDGALVPADLDWTRLHAIRPDQVGPLPRPGDTVTDYAQRLRNHAEKIRQHALRHAAELEDRADRIADMAEDGWELTTHPDQPYPMFRDTRDTRDDDRPDLRPDNLA